MKLHEFQTKQLPSDFGLTSPAWGVVITPGFVLLCAGDALEVVAPRRGG